MPSYWWVNHKQTYRQETDGGYTRCQRGKLAAAGWRPRGSARGHDRSSCGVPPPTSQTLRCLYPIDRVDQSQPLER